MLTFTASIVLRIRIELTSLTRYCEMTGLQRRRSRSKQASAVDLLFLRGCRSI